ncbi:MAG: restriction endonuclease subunit S [Saccharofermentanales bacterium]|jgi:type I restriction enzyme S subunit
MSKKRLVPKRRFKGFTDDWEQRKAKDVCSIGTGKSDTQDQVADGAYPFYIRSDIPVRSDKYLYDCEAVITIGDGNIGKVFHYVNGKFDLHQRCYKMADFRDIWGHYFYYFFSTKFYDRAMRMTAKATVDSVRLEMISEMDILKPTQLAEQTIIAEFFSHLDHLITLHQRKLEKAKSLKKSLLSEMFPAEGERKPKRRFPGFTGDWEQRKFSDIAITRRGLTYKPSDIRENGIRVLRSSNIDEDVFVIGTDDVFVDKSAINIPFAEVGDILITSANGSLRLVGKHAIIYGSDNIPMVHGGFMLIASSTSPYFLNASMGSSWYARFINLFVAGGNGAIGNLNKKDLDDQIILVPANVEQQRIGSFFRNLDHLITLHQRKLEKLQNLKKAYLNEMFI